MPRVIGLTDRGSVYRCGSAPGFDRTSPVTSPQPSAYVRSGFGEGRGRPRLHRVDLVHQLMRAATGGIDRLHTVNSRAIDLTEALLLLSRADRRSFTPERVDLSLIAEEAAESLLPLAEERGVTLETMGDIAATTGSPTLLLQLATNLVHNAIVHNLPDGGTVQVTTSVCAGSVVLAVENTGASLSPELVSTLTEPFQRGAERLRTHHAGVGLGLAIVDTITRAHDGTLVLAPRAGGGLRVTVELPSVAGSGDGRPARALPSP